MSTIASYLFKKEEPIRNQFLNIGVLIPAHNEEEGIKGRENTTHPPIFGVGGHEKRSLEAALHFMITTAEISAQWAYFSGFLGRVGPKKSKWGPIFTSQKSTQNVVLSLGKL